MTHEIVSVEFEAAGPGGVDGHRFRCSCGESAAYSFGAAGVADMGRRHARFMNEKERRESAQAQARAVRVIASRRFESFDRRGRLVRMSVPEKGGC